MTYQQNFKNICSCNIKECPLKTPKILEDIVDIMIRSPIELTQLRINNFIRIKLEELINEIIYSNKYYLVQPRVDFVYSEHNFVL